MNHTKPGSIFLIFAVLFTACKGVNKSDNADTIKKVNNTLTINVPDAKDDSIKLTNLVRAVYKWYETTPKIDGFNPIKKNPSDTLYSGIDLNKNIDAINDLKKTGMFAKEFLDSYRALAIRIDKELQDGSSLWPEGELPTFQDDVNEWCNCQDYPDNYWDKLTLKDIKLNKDDVSFKWTWDDDDDGFYKVRAKKEDGVWKISYLEGFDMNWYNWGGWKKNKMQ